MNRVAAYLQARAGTGHSNRFSEPHHTRFRSGIGNVGDRQIGGGRRRIDDRPLGTSRVISHQRNGGLAAEHHTGEVNAQ